MCPFTRFLLTASSVGLAALWWNAARRKKLAAGSPAESSPSSAPPPAPPTGTTVKYGVVDDLEVVPTSAVARWRRPTPSMRVYKSEKVGAAVLKGLSRVIEGLEDHGLTFHDLVKVLRDADQASFVYGGYLRDVISGIHADDVDILISGSVQTLLTFATDKGLPYYLKQDETTGRLRQSFLTIGDKSAKGKWSSHTLKDEADASAKCEGDFAMNANLWECSGFLIDPTGWGLHDAEHKLLRIPYPRSQWRDWVETDRLYGMRALRFFNFLGRGYQPADDETLTYVTGVMVGGFGSDDDATRVGMTRTLLTFLKRKVFTKSLDQALSREERFRTSTVTWVQKACAAGPTEPFVAIVKAAGGAAAWYKANITVHYLAVKKDTLPGLKKALRVLSG